MFHAIDIKTAITLILALTGLITTVFGLVNTLVKQLSEFLVRLMSATQKVVKASRKLTRDLHRPKSPAKDRPACVSSRVRQASLKHTPMRVRLRQQSLPSLSRNAVSRG